LPLPTDVVTISDTVVVDADGANVVPFIATVVPDPIVDSTWDNVDSLNPDNTVVL